jgi:hypothetical protein
LLQGTWGFKVVHIKGQEIGGNGTEGPFVVAPGGTGRGGPKEAEEVIVIVEALEIMVTWVGQVWALVVRGFKGCRGGIRGS